MALLKDNDNEQLRQLVKACLLDISKLKIELKKCQKDTSRSTDENALSEFKEDTKIKLLEKEKEINNLQELLDKKNQKLEELEIINYHFNALTAKPKKRFNLIPITSISTITRGRKHSRNPIYPYN